MSKKRPAGKQKGSAQKQADWKALDIVHPDAAGIDVGGSEHWVAVSPDRDPEPVRRCGCLTADLREMARWLIDKGRTWSVAHEKWSERHGGTMVKAVAGWKNENNGWMNLTQHWAFKHGFLHAADTVPNKPIPPDS